MNLSELPVEVPVSLLAIITIAASGCIAALHSWTRITAEQKGIKDADNKLISDDAWNDAYPHDKLKLATWLRQNGIKPDSHLGDFIRTCWSAWLGGRPASLTELHVLVARRERSHKATRLSAGIAALLLVCGIVGTLSAVKPVLEKFQLQVAEEAIIQPVTDGQQTDALSERTDEINAEEPDRDAALVAENARKVNKLIQNLGGAFYPSLLALLGTIVVVSCRGLYSLSLHRFTLDLDRFAVDTLIPRYRVPSLSEQYQEVKATLASVTETIFQREERFLGAVEQLENLVAGISPALSGLDAAATSTKEATEALTSGATSVTEALNLNLGAKSPIHRAVKGLDLVFEKTEKSLGNLSAIVEGIGESNATSQEKLGSAIQALGQSIERIGKDHQSRQSEAAKLLKDFKESLDDIPVAIQATGEKAVEVGLTAVKAGIEELNGEQKKWHAASAEDFKAATTASLAGVTKAGQDLAAQAGKVATAATDIQGIKADVSEALKGLTDAGKSQISQIGDATKSTVETAATKLSVEAEKIRKSAELMGRPQLETTPRPSPGKWAPTERNAPSRSDFEDNHEPIAGKVSSPTTTPVSTTPEPSAVMVPAPAGYQQTKKAPTASDEPPNTSYVFQRSTLTAVQPRDTLVGNAAKPDPLPKGKWWSRIPNPFSGKNS
jgi:hypothetical protein